MFGILTIAQGEKRYIEMAKMLAQSLLLTNPQIKRAVISDTPDEEFKGLYDIYIPYNTSFGDGLHQKLFLDRYSPFDETLFIDADCLAFKSLESTIELCKKYPFVVFGDQISSGEWYMDVAAMCRRFNVPSIPLFNGGTYYFNKSDITLKIYEKARQLNESYTGLGFSDFRGSINEEPLISIAMAINKVEAVDDKGFGMRTPIGINGPLKIDILNETCFFNKSGEDVSPAIMHFSGSFANAFHYKREVAKLKIYKKFPGLNKKLTSAMVNLLFNMPYGTLVFGKRILKMITRREKFDFGNRLPAFSNQ